MKETIKSRFTGILIMLAAAAVFGAAVMLLWNALLPQIFALQQINYPQAVGLLVLTRLLFGGIGGWIHGHRGRGEGHLFQHGNKLREKWMNMSEEERKEFIEKEKDFFKSRASHLKDFFSDKEKPE
jgi:ABC-type multidrug transport system fused ATPase/permease subunit